VCLVARHLEANGIPTLVLGSAHDILVAGRAPRAAFVDYPLGHSAGKPGNETDQRAVVAGALAGFASLDVAGQIVTLPNRWEEDGWRGEASSTDARDTRQPRDDSPQWQHDGDRDAARAAGQF